MIGYRVVHPIMIVAHAMSHHPIMIVARTVSHHPAVNMRRMG